MSAAVSGHALYPHLRLKLEQFSRHTRRKRRRQVSDNILHDDTDELLISNGISSTHNVIVCLCTLIKFQHILMIWINHLRLQTSGLSVQR